MMWIVVEPKEQPGWAGPINFLAAMILTVVFNILVYFAFGAAIVKFLCWAIPLIKAACLA